MAKPASAREQWREAHNARVDIEKDATDATRLAASGDAVMYGVVLGLCQLTRAVLEVARELTERRLG